MERLAAPAPVWSAPLKVPPVPSVAGHLASLLAEVMDGKRPEEDVLAEEEMAFQQDSVLSPLWAPSVFLEEEPEVAADAYRQIGAGWISFHEGRHLDLTV